MTITAALGRHGRLVLILTAAALLRLYGIDREGLWLDEGYSVDLARHSLGQILAARDTHPPLYALLLNVWIKIFGASEAAVRGLSALFGVLSVGALYRLCLKWFDRECALTAAFIAAFGVFQVMYSQEARPYALACLLGILSFDFFSELLKRPAPRAFALLAATNAAALYTHLFAVFTMAAQILFGLLYIYTSGDRKQGVRSFIHVLGAAAVSGAFFLPWAGITVQQAQALDGNFWIERPTPRVALEALIALCGGKKAALILLGLGALASAAALRRVKPARPAALFLVWGLVAFAGPYLLSVVATPLFHPRFLIAVTAVLYALAAAGLMRVRPRLVRIALTAALVLALANSLRYYYTHEHREGWRPAAAMITAEGQKDELVILHYYKTHHVFSYYFTRPDMTVLPFPEPSEAAPGVFRRSSHFVNEENLRALGPALEGRRRVWLVLSHSRDNQGLIERKLSEGFRKVRTRSFRNIELMLFEAD